MCIATTQGWAADGLIGTRTYSICPGDTLTITASHEVEVFRDTIFQDTIHVDDPTLDSITRYIVNIYPAYRQVEHREIVLGQTFSWCGETIHEPGTYTKVYKSQHDCDSTRVLVVTLKEGMHMEFRSQQIIPFCDSVAWNGTTYHESTIRIDTLRSLVYGCDSIVTTILQKGMPFRHYETDTISVGQTLYWHGQTITEAGEYQDINISRFGCDSTYVLRVELKASAPQPKMHTTRQSICQGDFFFWRGQARTLNGSYYDTAWVGTEIDTLFVLHLTVNPTYEFTETVAFSSFPQLYRGQTITGPGTYPITYISSGGCDSVINVIVNRQAIVHEETATICSGEEYVWRFQHLKEAQTYSETIKGKDGTDSVIYILHLNVHTIPETHITRTICQGDSYVFGTRILTEAGIYRHTFKQDGCDSVVVLSLNIADVDTIVQVHRLNPGETYTWPANGHTYSAAGTYQVTNINRFGCDSITRLVLTINHVDTIDTVATICPGETLIWHSISANQTGHYENAETGAHGDMRYYRLDLTVRELQEKEVQFSICGDESISFNGKTYDRAGYYYDKGTCDTLYHITISQAPLQTYVTNARLDGIHPYTWIYWHDGKQDTTEFSNPGTYEFTSLNATTGCNDTWRLVLSLDTTSYHFVEQVTLCEGEPYTWHGLTNISQVPGTMSYFDNLKTRTGQDSIYELQVTVRPKGYGYRTVTFCGSTTWKGTSYTASTIVYDTLTAANGCDSIVEISLRKTEGFFRRDTATIVQGERLVWHQHTITTSGVYYDTHTNQFGCDSTYELHVGIQPAAPQTNMVTTVAEICEGDYYVWRGNKYFNQGNYPDTVYATNQDERDTIYVLRLQVTQVERRHEQYTFCEGGRLESIYGTDYNDLVKTGEVYRDTVTVINPEHLGCPDTVFLEIYKYPKTQYTETVVLHPGDTVVWHGDTITHPTIITHSQLDEGIGGCGIDSTLRVIGDLRETVYVCYLDTPYVWREDTFYTSGLWFDTIYNSNHEIEQFYSLDLHITMPHDTTVYLHACKKTGVVWRDQLYLQDTTFIDRVPVNPYNPLNPCDSVFHVNIRIDTMYNITIDTTICEQDLPLIIGRQKPEMIWSEGTWPHTDTTACGCDSTIRVNLTIIPSIDHNDSILVCEEDIKHNPVVLGNLVDPVFDTREGGRYHGLWENKWHGVQYYDDTIVWNCDSSHFFHVIVRPTIVKDTLYYLCQGDSVQLFWPKQTWIKTAGWHLDTVPAYSPWVDVHHQYTYDMDTFACDSVTRWGVIYMHPEHTEETRHILLGDSLLFNGIWRHHTGDYDSIGNATDKDTQDKYCRLTHTLHLIVDTAYILRDTVELCERADKTITHTWADGHVTQFNTERKDTAFHVIHQLKTHSTLSLDSVYDLYVVQRLIHDTTLYMNICPGDSVVFDRHWMATNDNSVALQYISKAGTYRDTITAHNGCDSIITLHLSLYDRIATTHQTVHISDQQTPYQWHHQWTDADGNAIDSLRLLTASGNYSCHMLSRHGCDSIDSLTLFIHQTYHIVDDEINICRKETPYTWRGLTNITKSGDYVFSALTHDGYDSTHVVRINVWDQAYEELFFTTCHGDSILVNGKTYNQPGVYTDTLLTSHGCDSVLTIHLDWFDTYFVNKTAKTDDKTPYIWTEGNIVRTLNYSGTYYDTLPSIHGCDSIIALTLTVYPTYLFEENQIICESETPYLWHGRQYWTSGDYVDSMQTAAHYDSLFILHLTVRDTFYVEHPFTICHGESFTYNGKKYSHGGVYLDTLHTAYGCDSIVIIRVQERPHYFFPDTAATANRQPYLWRGRTLTHTGVYADTLTASTGCDSIYQLVLTVYDKEVLRDTAINACQTELPIHWRGKWLSQSGIIYDTITTLGVDTIWRVDVRITQMEYETIEKTLCAGDNYSFHGHIYTRDTLLRDTIQTGFGCGKEYTLFLRFRPLQVIDFYAKTPNKQPYIWHIEDATYSFLAAGEHEHIVRTKDGMCDSIRYVLHLTVGQTYLFPDSIRLCQSELPYLWRGQQIHDTGIYYDSLQTSLGYDSVYMLKVLQIMPSYYAEQHIELCEGSSAFYYRGKPYSTNGIFYDTIPSVDGCDSIFRINVRVLPTYEKYDTVHISDKETYEFDGRTLWVPGPYVAYKKTASGCDSIIHLQLQVHPSYLIETEEEICQKDTFIWRNGRRLVNEGIYYDSLLTTQGYDSVYKLHLIVHPTYFMQESHLICPGRSTYIHGIEISRPGIYLDTLYTIHGCDSIYQITVNETRTFRQEYSDTICQGETYNFYGVDYTTTRTVRYEIGCDSVIILHLVVRPKDIVEKKVVVADEDLPYRYKGHEYWNTDVYVDTFTNMHGCDSIFKLNLTISQHVSPWYQMPLCPGTEIKIGGDVITQAGEYTFLRRSQVSGLMDSLYRVQVYDAPAYDMPTETRRICQGDTLRYGGRELTRGGHYDFTLKTQEGCDSLLHLDLTVYPTYEFFTDATITDYQSYLWRGREYDQQGEFHQTYPTINDCDSTYTLRLTVIPTQRIHMEDSICLGEKYIWRGDTLYDTGLYSDTVCVLGTHTSVIYSLRLIVVPPTRLRRATINEVCADAQTLEVKFEYTGAEPTRYSILFDQLAKRQGFRDVIGQPFTSDMVARAPMPQSSDVIYLDHTNYVRPDYYTLSLVFDNTVCPSSTVDSVGFLVRYPSWIIEQNWSDVVAPLKPELNGGYTFSLYDWYVNGTRQATDGKGYLYSQSLREGDEVVLYATRQGESYPIPTCPLIIQRAAVPVYTYPVLVYPTQVSRRSPVVTLEATESGSYSVYSTAGMLVETRTFEAGTCQIKLPAQNGLWFIHTITSDGQHETHKIIMY